MKLHILFGQRKCRYDGEHAPEALDVADEFTMDENPAWLEGREQEHRATKQFVSMATVIVSIPMDAVEQALNIEPPVVDGKILNPPTP